MFGAPLAKLGESITDPNYLLYPMGLVTLLTLASAIMYSYDNWPVLRSLFRRAGQETI